MPSTPNLRQAGARHLGHPPPASRRQASRPDSHAPRPARHTHRRLEASHRPRRCKHLRGLRHAPPAPAAHRGTFPRTEAQRNSTPTPPDGSARFTIGDLQRHRCSTPAGSNTTPPSRFRHLSAKSARRSSTCRLASPTPSALRVSHPRSGFSRRRLVALFHATSAPRLSWAFRAFPVRTAVEALAPALLSCRYRLGTIPASGHRPADSQAAASATRSAHRPGFRALLRPNVRHLRKRCSHLRRPLLS